MASFDMIAAVGNAYQTVWQERRYLLRMALIPLLIKYICYALSSVYIEPGNIIRLSLAMVPAYFVEGWLLAHWARTIVLGHRWPFQPSGDEVKDMEQLQKRGRGIMSSMIVFVLINLLMAGYFAFFMSYIPPDLDPQTADPKIAMIGMVMIVTSLLLFRFVWFYIPLAVNSPPALYIDKLRPISLTFLMIALWLVCFVPPVVLMQYSSELIKAASGEGDLSPVLQGVLVFVRVTLDMIKNLLVTAGMAYAFIEIFGWKKKEA